MDASLIGIILASFFGLIILVSFLFGLKRGLKKSLFRLAWLLVTAVVLWFTTPLLSNYLNSFDLTSFGLVIEGETVHKLSDIGIILLNSMVKDESITSSSAVQSFAENFPTMILNVILFVLLFFILKYLLWVVWAPIASKIFDKDKRAKKRYDKRIKELKKKGMPITEEDAQFVMPKKNKYRLLGGVVGLVCGIMIGAVAFSPIVGLNAIYQNVSANITTTNDEGETVSFVNSQLGDETVAYVNSYQDSVASPILKYSGTEFLSNFLFSNMAVTEVEGEKVKLADEVTTGVKLYSGYIDVTDFLNNYKDASKEDLNMALASFKQIFFDMENSRLIYLLGDDLLPIFVEKYVIDNQDFQLDFSGIDVDELIRMAYKEYTKNNPLKVKEMQKQVESLVDIVQLLNDNDIALPLIKGEVDGFGGFAKLVATNVVGSNPDSAQNFSNRLVENMYKISLLENQYPTIIDKVVEGLYGSLDIEFVSNSNIQKDVLKEKFVTIFTNVFKFLKYYNDAENLDFGNNTQVALASLGEIIDCVGIKCDKDGRPIATSGILSGESYNNLISFLQGKANDFLESIGDLSSVTAKLADVNKKSSWTKELSSFAPLYKSVIKIKNGENSISVDKVLDGTYKIEETGIGEALHEIIGDGTINKGKSVILTNESMRDIFSALLNKIDDSSDIKTYLEIKVGAESTSGEGNRPTIKDNMLDAIYKDGNSQITNWKLELYDLVDVFINLKKTLLDNTDDLSVLSGETDTRLYNLGSSIDKAINDKTQLFVSNKNLRALVEKFLNDRGFEKGSQLDTILNEVTVQDNLSVKQTLLNNIYDYATKDSKIKKWQDELVALKPAFNGTLKNATNFEDSGVAIGGVLDDISSSEILSSDIVKHVVMYYLDEQTKTLDFGIYFNDLKKNNESKYNKNVDPVAVMKKIILNSNISYKTEIGNLLALTKILNANYSEKSKIDNKSEDWHRYNALGVQFNSFVQNGEGKSDLITKQVINCFLGYYLTSNKFDTGKSKLNAIIAKIPGDYNDTLNDYENLNTITNYKTEFNELLDLADLLKGLPALTAIGTQLDNIKSTTIIRFALKEILNYYVNDKFTADATKNATWVDNAKTEITNNIDKISITKLGSADIEGTDEILLKNINFANEFGFIQEFIDLAKQESGITMNNSADLLNKLAGVGDGNTYASRLLANNVRTEIISSIMTNKIDGMGETYTKEKTALLNKDYGIVTNVGDITNYETEFGYVNNLISEIENPNTDVSTIATQLDNLKESVLFSNELLEELVKINYDKEVNAYVYTWVDTEATGGAYTESTSGNESYKETLSIIRRNISAQKSFSTLFSELTTLKNNIDTLKKINNVSTFITGDNSEKVGDMLDNVEAMTSIDANDGAVAKAMMNVLVSTLENTGTETERNATKEKINRVLEAQYFGTHTKDSNNKTYYSTLISAIKTELTDASSQTA